MFCLFKDESESRPSSFACIENFPDELLIEIFTYLSVNDLKRVMASSRVFNAIVGDSTKLMKKFVMKIAPKKKWDFEALEKFERKHQNVKLLDFKCDEGSVGLLAVGLLNIGRNVKLFELNDSEISFENLLKIMRTMNHLTTVYLTNVNFSGDIYDSMKDTPDFFFLTNLNIIKSGAPFDIFKKAKNLIEIYFDAENCKSLNLVSFEELLILQTKLKILTLIKIQFCNFLDHKIFPFQLKSLTIHQCYFKEKECLERFLEMQKRLENIDLAINSLNLKLDHARYFDDSLCVIANEKSLKNFSLEIDNYNFINTNFLRHCLNANVEDLKLSMMNTCLPIMSILRAFPKITSLELSVKEIDQETIEYFNVNLNNLRNLKILKFPSEAFGKLKLKSLNSLHMYETNIQLEHWMEFLESNSNITKLIINFTFFMDLNEEFIDTITKKLKLEHLELIEKWIGMRNEIYLTICQNSPKLKYLKLWNINVEKDFDEQDKEYLRSRNIRFHLFNDESLNTPMVPF